MCQDFFHNVFFFTVNKFWRRWHSCTSSSDGVWWSESELNNIEHRVEASHGARECWAVGVTSNMAFDSIWPKATVRQLPRWASHVDVTRVQIYLVARGKRGRWSAALVVVPCHIILGLGQHRPCLLKRALHLVSELIHCFDSRWRLVQFEAHPRVSASVKEKWHLLRGGVDVVVVRELCEWEERVPVVLSFPNEET